MVSAWKMTAIDYNAIKHVNAGQTLNRKGGLGTGCRPVRARGRCRISPPRFLAECCKRQLNQVSLVLLYFRLSAFSDLH